MTKTKKRTYLEFIEHPVETSRCVKVNRIHSMAKYEINGLKYDLNVDTGTASVVEGSVPEMLELVIPDSIEVDGKNTLLQKLGVMLSAIFLLYQ